MYLIEYFAYILSIYKYLFIRSMSNNNINITLKSQIFYFLRLLENC
jgi:hypothetical protein